MEPIKLCHIKHTTKVGKTVKAESYWKHEVFPWTGKVEIAKSSKGFHMYKKIDLAAP